MLGTGLTGRIMQVDFIVYTPYMTHPTSEALNITNHLKRGNTNEWYDTETDQLYKERHVNQTISVI